MTFELKQTLINISQVSAFIPVIFGLYYAKKLDTSFRILLGFVLLSLFMEYFATWYKHHYGNNIPPLHFYSIIEFSCLTYIFCNTLFSTQRNSLFSLAFSFGMILAILNVTLFGSIYEMNNIARTYDCVVLVLFSLIYFRKSLTILPNAEPIFEQPMFWFSNAVLVYFPINLLFFLFFNKLYVNHPEIARVGFMLHSLANITANILFAQAFRCFRKAA